MSLATPDATPGVSLNCGRLADDGGPEKPGRLDGTLTDVGRLETTFDNWLKDPVGVNIPRSTFIIGLDETAPPV